MKGVQLWTKILAGLIIILTSTMVLMNYAPSWSQYALGIFSFFLTITLWSISIIYRDRSWNHPKRNMVMFELRKYLFFGKKQEIRQEHWDRQTSLLFACVMFTPVTLITLAESNGIEITWWISTIVFMHYVFTGVAILSSYIGIFFGNKNGSILWFKYLIGMILAIVLFALSFIIDLYTTGMGEIFAMLPPLVYILTTNKK